MSKGNDINVNSIDEDIKIIKNSWLYNDEENVKFVNAIEHILQDYTRQKQINEQYQKINEELREKIKALEENRMFKNNIEEYYKKWKKIKEMLIG